MNNLTVQPKTVDEAVERIIFSMSFRERILMASISEGEVTLFEQLLTEYLRVKLINWSANESFINDCLAKSEGKDMSETSALNVIIEEFWGRLKQTHKVRVVK